MTPMRDRLAVVAALLLPATAAGVLAFFRDSLESANAALVLVLAVVAEAANGNRLAGVLASLSAGFWFDLLLTRPYGHLTITHRADVESTLLLLAVGVAVTELALWGRRTYARAERDAGYLAGIRTSAEAVASGGSASEVIAHVSAELTKVLGLSECHFERGTAGVGSPARLRHDGEIEWQGRLLDGALDELPGLELIVEQGGRLRGRFVMKPAVGSQPSRPQRLVAVTLANQVGALLG